MEPTIIEGAIEERKMKTRCGCHAAAAVDLDFVGFLLVKCGASPHASSTMLQILVEAVV